MRYHHLEERASYQPERGHSIRLSGPDLPSFLQCHLSTSLYVHEGDFDRLADDSKKGTQSACREVPFFEVKDYLGSRNQERQARPVDVVVVIAKEGAETSDGLEAEGCRDDHIADPVADLAAGFLEGHQLSGGTVQIVGVLARLGGGDHAP